MSLPKYTLCKTLNEFKKEAEKKGYFCGETVGDFELARFEKKGFSVAILWKRTCKRNNTISGNESAYKICPTLFRKKI